jgi:hypothetical protein
LLLRDMRQFMGQQFPPISGARSELTGSKDHIATSGVSMGIYITRRFPSALPRMYSHAAEVAPEAGFEIRARRFVQRLPGGTQHLMHAGRGLAEAGLGRTRLLSLNFSLNFFFFLLAGFAFSADLRRRRG